MSNQSVCKASGTIDISSTASSVSVSATLKCSQGTVQEPCQGVLIVEIKHFANGIWIPVINHQFPHGRNCQDTTAPCNAQNRIELNVTNWVSSIGTGTYEIIATLYNGNCLSIGAELAKKSFIKTF